MTVEAEAKTAMDPNKKTLITMLSDISTTCTGLQEETLARYAELQMAGRRPQEEMPQVGAHLQECPDCAAQYADLLALLQAEAKGEVPAVSSSRPFDLSFLPADKLWLWTSVHKDLRRLVAEIPCCSSDSLLIISRYTAIAFSYSPISM